MKQKILFLIAFLNLCFAFSQIPNGCYNSATGDGYTLKTQLNAIIKNGHIDNGYSALYDAYKKTDNYSFYENDNTVLDMYSENPSGTDSYNYNHNNRNCGNYNSENDCCNREHIFPQGFFNQESPMKTDIHHVVPSDGYVNGRRSNFPFGEVSNISWQSNNGSKVGTNNIFGYTGTVFEPIDEFKGDIARMLFYFATRYENEVTNSSWDAPNASISNPLNGTNNQVYETWYIKLLYKWHTEDPISQREIIRNNEAYNFQKNRNPFIDHPEYVSQIWGSVLSVNKPLTLEDIKIYPNPIKGNDLFIKTTQITQIKIYNIIGKLVLSKILNSSNNKVDISKLDKGVYLIKIVSQNKITTKKVIKS